MTCNQEDLLGLARGELAPAKADEVEAHTEGCASCARELAWLRTERALFRAHSAAPPAHVWQGIERRLVIAGERQRERRRRWMQVGSGATVLAAAASVLFYLWTQRLPIATPTASERPASSTGPEMNRDDGTSSDATEALSSAEREYRGAIRKLEKAYVRERDNLDPDQAMKVDEELRKLREVVMVEREAAQDDVWARKRVLHAYSTYMRTMQAVVLEVPK